MRAKPTLSVSPAKNLQLRDRSRKRHIHRPSRQPEVGFPSDRFAHGRHDRTARVRHHYPADRFHISAPSAYSLLLVSLSILTDKIYPQRPGTLLLSRQSVNNFARCSKRPDFSPAQPRRAETRRSAGKAAAKILRF